MLEHLNGNRGRAVSARVLTVVFLLLALLPAGPAAAADDGSFLSPLAYWGLDDGAATVTEEDGAWSASLRVEKLDSRSALDEYAIFLVGTYPFILSDTSFQEEEGSYAWSYRFSYTGSAAVESLPGKEGCHLWLHASAHGTWDYTEIGWAWSDGLNPVSGDQSAQASPAREESAQGAGSAQAAGNAQELVAQPLTSTAAAPGDAELMALEYYADGLKVGSLGEDGSARTRSLDGTASDYRVLEAYVDLLCTAYSFELVDTPYYEQMRDTFFDFCLRYTGSASLYGSEIRGVFSDTPCNVMIYGIIDGDDLEGYIYYDRALTTRDGGYRYGSASADTGFVGDSFAAGLYRLSDGSFATDDGALQAAPGQAMVVQDGAASMYNARAVYDTQSSHLEFWVEDDRGGAYIQCYFPLSQDIATGQIYTEEDFIVESSYAVKAGGRFEDMPSYTWPTMFAAWHGSEYVVPVLGMGGDMKRLNLRVMYADGETAVLYACAQFATAPRELGVLMAVSFADAETTSAQASASAGGKQKCSACSGSGDCTRCGGTGRLYKTLPGTTERVEQDCTSCRPAGSGHCSFCGGTGYR